MTLNDLLDLITPENIHLETDMGRELGKEIVEYFDCKFDK